ATPISPSPSPAQPMSSRPVRPSRNRSDAPARFENEQARHGNRRHHGNRRQAQPWLRPPLRRRRLALLDPGLSSRPLNPAPPARGGNEDPRSAAARRRAHIP